MRSVPSTPLHVASRAAARSLSFLLGLLVLAPPAGGASVRSVSVEEALARAELVFEGEVVSRGAEHDPALGRVRTCAHFRMLEVLKGPSLTELRLCFSSAVGPVAGPVIDGLNLPAIGERGFYFVESLAVPLVNPIYGWDQGRFRVEASPDGASALVTTAGGEPVRGVRPDGPPPPGGLSEGVARGIEIASDAGASTDPAAGVDPAAPAPSARRASPPPPPSAPPLTPAQFKERLRAIQRGGAP